MPDNKEEYKIKKEKGQGYILARFQTYPKVRDTGNGTDPHNVGCVKL